MNKRKKIITKKNANRMFIVAIVFLVIVLLQYLGYFIINKYLGYTLGTVGQIAYIIFGVLFLLSVLVESVFQLAYWFQGVSAHVIKYRGRACFEEIDSFIRNLGECNNYYCGLIFKINEVYETNQELKQLYEEKNLEALYIRKTFLENNLDVYNNLTQHVAALGVSSVVVLAQTGLIAGGSQTSGYFIIAGIVFLLCVALKYIAKGRGDSYTYNVYEYELKLLNENILRVNEQLQANDDIEKVLRLRQAIIDVLINLYNNRKKLKKARVSKKNVDEMYKTLYALPLIQELEEKDVIWAQVDVCGVKKCFPVKIEGGRYKCLTENYEKVYEMLQRISGGSSKA
ncbi:MAG: hypothetical protein HDR28_11720 [Lachnospiraceae bacterium]|nr:hypothetical protein [Lachnospiraceae bacterium]